MSDTRETSIPPKWEIVRTEGGYQEWVEDTAHNSRLFFLTSTGFGTPARSIELAQRVCDYLNSLAPQDTVPYPFIWKP